MSSIVAFHRLPAAVRLCFRAFFLCALLAGMPVFAALPKDGALPGACLACSGAVPATAPATT